MGITMHVTMGLDTDADPVDDIELVADIEGDTLADTEGLRLEDLVGKLDKLDLPDDVSDADVDGEVYAEGGAVTTDVKEDVELARFDLVIDEEVEGERELVGRPVVAAAESETFGLRETEGEARADGLAVAETVNGSQ